MPFGKYKDFDACVRDNSDKSSPGGYCAALHKKITGKWPTQKEMFKFKEDFKVGDKVSWSDTSSSLPRDRRPQIKGTISSIKPNGDIVIKRKDGKVDTFSANASIWLKKESINKESIPSNILDYAKRKGVVPIVKKIDSWLNRLGLHISGGTAIGKFYDTLILDIHYQDSAIYIQTDTEKISVYNQTITDFNSFKKAVESHKKESNKSLNKIYEKICKEAYGIDYYILQKDCFVGKKGDVIKVDESGESSTWHNLNKRTVGSPFVEYNIAKKITEQEAKKILGSKFESLKEVNMGQKIIAIHGYKMGWSEEQTLKDILKRQPDSDEKEMRDMIKRTYAHLKGRGIGFGEAYNAKAVMVLNKILDRHSDITKKQALDMMLKMGVNELDARNVIDKFMYEGIKLSSIYEKIVKKEAFKIGDEVVIKIGALPTGKPVPGEIVAISGNKVTVKGYDDGVKYTVPKDEIMFMDKYSSKESFNIKEIEDIIKSKSAKKIDGVLVDMQSANAIVKVYNALSEENKKRFISLPIVKAANMAWKLL